MIDGVVGDERERFRVDPLPERHVLGHVVRLHLRLHFNVEDLQGSGGWKSNTLILQYTTTVPLSASTLLAGFMMAESA